MRPLPAILLATALLSTVHAQTPRSDADIATIVQARAGDYVAWGPQLNQPGTSLALSELSRGSDGVHYKLTATGLPLNRTYQLVSFPITSDLPVVVMEGVSLNDSGVAICTGSTGHCAGATANDPVALIFKPAKGEPYRVALFATGAGPEIRAFAKTIPIPNEASDAGCKAAAVLLYPNSEALLIEGSGFAPNAPVQMLSTSAGEQQNSSLQADSKGEFRTSLLPYVKGKDKGLTQVTLKSAACAPVVSFAWGKGVNTPQ